MKPIVRVPLVLLLTAVAISLGVVGVHASTGCVRFITRKVRHHKVSAATAARWAAWDKAHPNWHPKTPKETLAQLDFACAVPLVQKPVDGELPPIDLTAFNFAPDLKLPPPADTPPVNVAMNEPPQDLLPDGPSPSLVLPPIYTPPYPTLFGPPPTPPPTRSVTPPPGGGNPGLAPEPSSWMLLATSVLAIGALYYRRPQMAKVVARRRRF